MKEIVISFIASREEAANALRALFPNNDSPSRALASRKLSDFARDAFLDACGKLEARGVESTPAEAPKSAKKRKTNA